MQTLKSTVTTHKATVAQQMEARTTRLKEQAARIQKMSDQLELRQTAPRTVLNNQ